MDTHDSQHDKQFVGSVAKAVRILSCFRQDVPLLGNQELSSYCGMPKSTVSRFTYTLTKLGCLEFDGRYEKYRLGARIASLGHAMVAGYDVAAYLQPHMQRLANRFDCLVTLGAYENDSIVCLASAHGSTAGAPVVDPGMHVSAFRTAMGRAYLASCGRLERQRIIDRVARQRPTHARELEQTVQRAVNEYARRGYCSTIEGWRKGRNGLAVPLFLKGYGRRLVLGCGVDLRALAPESITGELSTFLLQIANDIEVAFERARGGGGRRAGTTLDRRG